MKFTAITQTKHEGDNSIMREGYTSQAKKALAYAVKTAEKCGHNYVGTEHLLIGLLNVEDGTAGMVLTGSSPLAHLWFLSVRAERNICPLRFPRRNQ